MTQYGDTQTPGIVTDVTSSVGIPTADSAVSDVGIVGQADLGDGNAQGSADPNVVYEVTRATSAEQWFGDPDNSLLTEAIIDALNEGAYPIYAVAAESIEETGEDHSSVSTTEVTLDNGPIREDSDAITITLDGTTLTANIVYDDPSSYSPDSGECYVNPVLSEVEIPTTPSNSLTADYEHFDYSAAHDVMATDAGETIDFLTPISERRSVVDDAKETVGSMESEYELALLDAGAEIYINDPASYENPYDDSRTQLIYPTRFDDGTSAVAAYAGRRAAIGIETTPINKTLAADKSLHPTQARPVDRSFRGQLIDNNVVPLANEAAGARIVDDPTTVTEENKDEQNIEYGFNRLVMDFIIQAVRESEKPFIGRLNNPAVRNTLGNLIEERISQLTASNVVLSYSINVAKGDATTATLEINVDLAEPLRFIENTVTVGE